MRRFLQLGPIMVYAAVVASVAIQQYTRRVELHPLDGEPLPENIPAPVCDLRHWFDGTLQAELSSWYPKILGFRPLIIRLYNEVLYSALHDANSGSRSKVVVGRDEELFTWYFVSRSIYHATLNEALLEARVEKLKRVQSILHDRGIALVVVITPSKASVYHDKLPYRFSRGWTSQPPPLYARMRSLLEDAGVRYLDFDREFLRKRTMDDQFGPFPKTGVHWNHVSAGYALERIFKEGEAQLGVDIERRVPVGVASRRTIDTDRDALSMLNLLSDSRRALPSPYPLYRPHGVDGALRARVLLVGDSFAGQIVRIMADQDMCDYVTYWWYFRSEATVGSTVTPAFARKPIAKDSIDWNQLLDDHNLVVIEFNKAFCKSQQVQGFGWGFADALADAFPAPSETSPDGIRSQVDPSQP
jgi:hypothetical protein